MSDASKRLSSGRIVVGLLVAAATAWAAIVVASTWPAAIDVFVNDGARPSDEQSRLLSQLTIYALFGIPIAVVFCLAVGFPVWRLLDKKEFRRGIDAALGGAITGALIGTLVSGISLFSALAGRQSSWGNQGQVFAEGWPTALGWWNFLVLIAIMSGIGVLAGLAAWLTVIRAVTSEVNGTPSIAARERRDPMAHGGCLTAPPPPSKTRGSAGKSQAEWKHPWRGSPRLSARTTGAEEGSIS